MAAMTPPSDAAERTALEAFISRRFERAYGAKLRHFLPNLLGLRDDSGQWLAAVGYAAAADGPLFLEQYLDTPVERALSGALGLDIPRDRIAEVGNFAAIRAGVARQLIPALATRLREQGFEHVVFTATRELRNAFLRLKLVPAELAVADPARLRPGSGEWGTYYLHRPSVLGGRIADCLRRLG
jgi:hypothetical protein